jgi:hypothetical protein
MRAYKGASAFAVPASVAAIAAPNARAVNAARRRSLRVPSGSARAAGGA